LAVPAKRVLGVDACRAGWVGLAFGEAANVRGYAAADIDQLVGRAELDGLVAVVAIDIPIGLPDRGRRKADLLAKVAVGPRRSSVFMTPVRDALTAPDHATAVRINRDLAGEGVSAQEYALRRKLLDVDAWARQTDHRVIEVHPEVSFARLADGPLQTRKSTWAGIEQRRQLLAAAGIRLAGAMGLEDVDAGVDDVLDAAAAAWTARRYLVGEGISLPDPPETFADGWPAAIWV
jgi:predicted RNase H-like nuclease